MQQSCAIRLSTCALPLETKATMAGPCMVMAPNLVFVEAAPQGRDDWCLMPANTAAACCVGPVQQPHGRERHWHQQLVWALDAAALGEAFRKGASRSGPSRRLEGTQELLPNRLHRRQAKSISGQTMGRCQTLAVLGINRCLNETEVDNTQGGSRKLLALQGELQKCRPDHVELSQSDMRLSVSRRIWNQRSRKGWRRFRLTRYQSRAHCPKSQNP